MMSSHILWKMEVDECKRIMEKLLGFLAFLLLCSHQQKKRKEHFLCTSQPDFYAKFWVPFLQE